MCGSVAAFAAPSPSRLPPAELNLRLAAPIKTWDEAVPLGNGAMGVLLWGETNLLRLSLDRGDLWDERPSKRFTEVRTLFNWRVMQGLVASNRMAEFNDIFDSNYDYHGPPTKLPAGRVEITLDPAQTVEAFELNLATAEGRARFPGGEARAFVNAASVREPVALVRIAGPPPQARLPRTGVYNSPSDAQATQIPYNGAGWQMGLGLLMPCVILFVDDPAFLELDLAPVTGTTTEIPPGDMRAKVGLELLRQESITPIAGGWRARFAGTRHKNHQQGIQPVFIATVHKEWLAQPSAPWRLMRVSWRTVEQPP